MSEPRAGPKPTGSCSAHRAGQVGCMTCFPPSHLWAYANNLHPRNDANRQALYLQLMVEHGYVVRMEQSDG